MNSLSRNSTYKLLLSCCRSTQDNNQPLLCIDQPIDWDELYTLATQHNVLPLVYSALKDMPLGVPVPILTKFREAFAVNTLHNLQMQNEMRRLVALFVDAGIPVIPFKGPTLAEEIYGDIALRTFVDLDFLVPVDLAWNAVQIVLQEGYTLDFELPEKRWDSLSRIDNHLFFCHADSSISVEIHWQVFHPTYALPFNLDKQWQMLATENGASCEGRLTAEDNLVLLCAHGTKHFWDKLKWIADIDRLISAYPSLGWESAFCRARQEGSARAVFLGLSLAQDLCGTALPPSAQALLSDAPVVCSLAEKVKKDLFSEDKKLSQRINCYLFLLQSRERWFDRYRQIVRWLFYPYRTDWQAFPLGDRCFFLYYLERPCRMFWKWVVVRG